MENMIPETDQISEAGLEFLKKHDPKAYVTFWHDKIKQVQALRKKEERLARARAAANLIAEAFTHKDKIKEIRTKEQDEIRLARCRAAAALIVDAFSAKR